MVNKNTRAMATEFHIFRFSWQPKLTGGACLYGRDAIRAEMLRQREAHAMLVVEAANESEPESGLAFWQLTNANTTSDRDNDGNRGNGEMLFLMVMDPAALSPKDRSLSLRLGGGASGLHFDVFDQLGSPTSPIGRLSAATVATTVQILIPAGTARFFTLRQVAVGPSSACATQLEALCANARRASIGSCLVCASANQGALERASCSSPDDIDQFCNSGE